MATFLFLYRGGAPVTPGLDRARMEAHLRRWDEWVAGLAERGVLMDSGRSLDRRGRVVGPEGVVEDGPFAESKEVVGGYSVLQARDLATACELAKGCPIYEFGGHVEVRPVVDRCLDPG